MAEYRDWAGEFIDANRDGAAKARREVSFLSGRQCSRPTSITSRRPFKSGDAATQHRAEERDARRATRPLFSGKIDAAVRLVKSSGGIAIPKPWLLANASAASRYSTATIGADDSNPRFGRLLHHQLWRWCSARLRHDVELGYPRL